MSYSERILDISWSTIIKIALAFIGFYLLYLIRDILIWLIFALIISVLFDPAITFLRKSGLPRVLSTIFVYVLSFGILGGLIYLIAPPFVSEIQKFTQLFPQYFEKISPPLSGLGIKAFESIESFTSAIEGWLVRASANIFSAVFAFFGGIFSTVTIFAIAIFLSLEEKGMEKALILMTPKKYEGQVLNIWERTKIKIARWFGSRILLSIFIGLLTFIACHVLNIEYAVSFGLLAGIFDLVPIIGPVVAGVIIVIFTSLESWIKALFILIIFLLIQQIEGNILTPVLTKKFIGLPAVLVIIALMVGGKLWGVLGAVLAIPLFGLFYEFLKDFLKRRKEREAVLEERV
jgi:predicted PurR-regulated permease PerM